MRSSRAICPAGSYCANGVAQVCPGGRFGATVGLTLSGCSGECAAGYYCPPNATTPYAFECGSAEVYCPAGSAAPRAVPPGMYSIGGFNATTRTGTAECGTGTFCLNGVLSLCPAGRYGCSILVSDPQCNGPCLEGFWCGNGSDTGTQHTCGEGRAYPSSVYCPSGSSSPLAVPAGHYGLGGSPPDRLASEAVCPLGHYCDHGLKVCCVVRDAVHACVISDLFVHVADCVPDRSLW